MSEGERLVMMRNQVMRGFEVIGVISVIIALMMMLKIVIYLYLHSSKVAV